MEKLIELLNEFNWKESFWLDTDSISWEKYINRWDWNQCFIYEHIISKKFWFIEWLVENDKIDRNLVDWAILHKTHRLLEDDYWVENMNKQYYEKTLMLLAISDTPIDLLCEILKDE